MRFVSPETVRIQLADGPDGSKNWIEIKKDLTAGEEKRYRSSGLRRMTARTGTDGSDIDIDWQTMAFARVEAYLLDWSARDAKDKPIMIASDKQKRDALEALDPVDFEEIDAAIQNHMTARAEEKKATTGSPTPTATSPS